jgi:hypothetical protein
MTISAIQSTSGRGYGGQVKSTQFATKPTIAPPLDLEGLLHLAQMKRRDIQQTAQETEVRSIQGQRDLKTREARAAQQLAEKEGAAAADSEKGAAFWKKCACWAGAVAAVAATCCTAGTAAPLAVAAIGLALSVGSSYIGEKVAQATGSKTAGQWTAIGCVLAGATLQVVSGSPTAAGGSIQAVARGTQLVASGASGAATAAEGYRTHEAKTHDANAEDARADALMGRSSAKRAQSEMDGVVEELRSLEGSIRRALDAVAGIGRELNAGRERVAMHLARSC